MSLYDLVFLTEANVAAGAAPEDRAKISAAAMNHFTRRFDAGKFGTQRFGQAFLSTHGERLNINIHPRMAGVNLQRKAAERLIWQHHVAT